MEGVREIRFDSSQLTKRVFSRNRSFTERIEHPWTIVLSPDCDLEWDFKARNDNTIPQTKLMNNIILCSLESEGSVASGEGLRGDFRIKNSGDRERVKSNRDERYHFLDSNKTDNGTDVVEFFLDFKRVFTVSNEFIYAATEQGLMMRHGCLDQPWVQHLTHRFTFFLGRVGLPDGDV